MRAIGESYCIAHHLFTEDGERKLMVAWLRYGDIFAKVEDNWRFAERNLYVDWTEKPPLASLSARIGCRDAHGWDE